MAELEGVQIMETASYRAMGRVQNVMFRQTLIRGAQKRGLEAGATNDASDRRVVTFTLCGDAGKIAEIVNFLSAGSL